MWGVVGEETVGRLQGADVQVAEIRLSPVTVVFKRVRLSVGGGPDGLVLILI